MKTMIKFNLKIMFILLYIIISPTSAVFSLEEIGNLTASNISVGEQIHLNATAILLPEGQPFNPEHSIVISGDLLNQKFNSTIYAGKLEQKNYENSDGVVFITGPYLSYKVSPQPKHQYQGSTVSILIETSGIVPEKDKNEIELIQVIEIDGTGKPVYDGIRSIKANVNPLPKTIEDSIKTSQSQPEQQKSPISFITLIISSLCAVCLYWIRNH